MKQTQLMEKTPERKKYKRRKKPAQQQWFLLGGPLSLLNYACETHANVTPHVISQGGEAREAWKRCMSNRVIMPGDELTIFYSREAHMDGLICSRCAPARVSERTSDSKDDAKDSEEDGSQSEEDGSQSEEDGAGSQSEEDGSEQEGV
jgi:hypothetical protein